MRGRWLAVGAAFVVGVVAVVVATSDDGGPEQEFGAVSDFCAEASRLSLEAAVEGDEPFTAESLAALSSVAPDEEIRASIADALDTRRMLDELNLDEISLTRTEEEDRQAERLQASLTADLAPIGLYLAEHCQSEIEEATADILEFDTPPEAGASSTPADLRDLPDLDLGEVNLGSTGSPAMYEVSYRGGVTCLVTEEGNEICYPEGRANQDRMMDLTFTVDVMSGFAPGTTGEQIVFRDTNGFEFTGEMLTPHLWRAEVPAQAVGPFTVGSARTHASVTRRSERALVASTLRISDSWGPAGSNGYSAIGKVLSHI